MSTRRRSTRANNAAGGDDSSSKEEILDCPACTEESRANPEWGVKWVGCDSCKTWYHWSCAGEQSLELEKIDKWYCQSCRIEQPGRVITFRGPARKSHRQKTQKDYAHLDTGKQSDPTRFLRMFENKEIHKDTFRRMHGSEVNIDWVEDSEDAMVDPIIIEIPDGLEMKMPSSDFTVEDVAELVGEDYPLEVIDVASQSTAPGWTLKKWVDYINLKPEQRDKIYNVISLEVSGTPLADKILPPKLVRDLDWVENYWPNTRKGRANSYPKVQLYSLMGVGGAWTDWHIDFAGSSVYYHIVRGAKVFYFIRPTSANLKAYERWSGSDIQNNTWLGDLVDEVIKVELTSGNTMIIPSGWIHAVYTPEDTIVFGGNFLHSFSVAMQLAVREIEIATQVPKKFRFPMFSKLCWFVGEKYMRDFKASPGSSFPARVLSSICDLADFLVSTARILERGTDAEKKDVKDQIPSDRIKDAPAFARELRWRVRFAAGQESDNEAEHQSLKANRSIRRPLTKRKRSSSRESEDESIPRFRNFRPKPWDRISDQSGDYEQVQFNANPPNYNQDWQTSWMEWNDAEGVSDSKADVTRQRNVLTKLRRIEDGLERERCERVVEKWTWK